MFSLIVHLGGLDTQRENPWASTFANSTGIGKRFISIMSKWKLTLYSSTCLCYHNSILHQTAFAPPWRAAEMKSYNTFSWRWPHLISHWCDTKTLCHHFCVMLEKSILYNCIKQFQLRHLHHKWIYACPEPSHAEQMKAYFGVEKLRIAQSPFSKLTDWKWSTKNLKAYWCIVDLISL